MEGRERADEINRPTLRCLCRLFSRHMDDRVDSYRLQVAQGARLDAPSTKVSQHSNINIWHCRYDYKSRSANDHWPLDIYMGRAMLRDRIRTLHGPVNR